MFGLNEITWKEFLLFVLTVITIWYCILLLWAWFKSSDKPTILYEEYIGNHQSDNKTVKPITVSSNSFPSKLISSFAENSIPLEVSFYEEIWSEDGVQLDYLLNETTGKMKKLLPGIQYQQ